jgi:TonB family protein
MRCALALFIALYPLICFAQKDTAYFKGSTDADKLFKATPETADFYRVSEREGDKYRFTDYKMKGAVLTEGYTLSLDTQVYDGYFIEYYENGKKREYGNYIKGNKVGQWKLKYEDTDRIWAVIDYYPNRKDTSNMLTSFYRSGKIKRKEWCVKDLDVGVCYDESGKEIPFTPFQKMPEFKGDCNRFLGENISYPYSARERGEDGRVLVKFVVDKDGSLTDVSAEFRYSSLARESVRVVKSMPNWRPGTLDDEPVRVHFTLPVLFRIE